MAWDIDQVRDAINDVENERVALVRQMDAYEKAWRLEFWTDDDRAMALDKGWKLYTSPEPRNVVSMAMNLLNGRLSVVCPAYEATTIAAEYARACGRFLELLIDKQGKVQEMGLLESLGWFGAVRGRMAVQVAWVWNTLTDEQKKFMPPVLYRVLDPKNVGFKRDAYGTQWAFHKYKENRNVTKKRYPSYFKDKTEEGLLPREEKSGKKALKEKECEIVDFYYVEKGVVYHAVLIDNEFAKKPTKSQFPKIPLLERNNDPSPAMKERWRSGSVLDGMLNTWGEMNYLHSMHLTAIAKKYFPAMFFSNDDNQPEPIIDSGPDAINVLPAGIRPLQRPDDRPDVNLVTSALEMMDDYAQKATFPNAIYGETGAQRAAYGQHMTMATAARRVAPLKSQMEALLEEANEIALFMLKKFSPDEIEIFGYDRANNQGISIKLDDEMIGDRFDNKVNIDMIIPGSQLQEMIGALQLVDRKLLSDETFIRLFMPNDKFVPEDEHMRVLVQEIEKDPDLKREMVRRAFFNRNGYELPPGEPDYEMTPPDQPAQRGTPQGPPPGGPPMDPMAMQAQGPMMGSPEFQGGMSPDMMGLPPEDPETAMMMQLMSQGRAPGPQAQQQMLGGQYRRR